MPTQPNSRSVADPTGDQTAVSIAQAAERLGLTTDAVRMRLKRGQLAGAKIGTRWIVYLDPTEQPTEQATEQTEQPDPTATEQTEHDAGEIAFLRDLVAQLHQTIDQMQRNQTAERERFDVIHREALVRIEALTAGDGATVATSNQFDDANADTSVTRSDGPQREEGPEASAMPSHEPSIVTGWLRRLLGRS